MFDRYNREADQYRGNPIESAISEYTKLTPIYILFLNLFDYFDGFSLLRGDRFCYSERPTPVPISGRLRTLLLGIIYILYIYIYIHGTPDFTDFADRFPK